MKRAKAHLLRGTGIELAPRALRSDAQRAEDGDDRWVATESNSAARWTLTTLDGRDCSRDLAPKKYTEITAELRVISPLHPSDGIFTQGVADLLASIAWVPALRHSR